MSKVYSKALEKSLDISRIIGKIEGNQPGPTVIFMSGIHGNEPSGVFALHQVFKEINESNPQLQGTVYALSGNLWALERGMRFQKEDLNRLWKEEKIEKILQTPNDQLSEDAKQLKDIYQTLFSIIESHSPPFYFFDLHTTSSETIPFITVNDSLLNRKFTRQYPLPLVLGIEEYLDGPLLSYINKLGYVAFGYEAGQHHALSAIENQVAFVYLSLFFSGVLIKKDTLFYQYYEVLAKSSMGRMFFYEIFYRYHLSKTEKFIMKPGYVNFQLIKKDEIIAYSNDQEIKAIQSGKLFMPLYQGQGEDGFFLIKRVPKLFLTLSALLRKMRFDKILPLLPGVSWASEKKDALWVNKKIAWLFAKEFFHLLGYRSREVNHTHLLVKNREDAAKYDDYVNEEWMRG